MQKRICLFHLWYKESKYIGLVYRADKVITALVKDLEGIEWSMEHEMYCMPNSKKGKNEIIQKFRGVIWLDWSRFFTNRPVNRGMNPPLHLDNNLSKDTLVPKAYFDKLKLKRYSQSTAKSYVHCFEKFLAFFNGAEPMQLTEVEIRQFMHKLIQDGKSISTQNQFINAIKFYYEVVMGMPQRFYALERPMKEKSLPVVCSKEEILKMIASCTNMKHKCMIELLYSAGLRRSELLNLSLSDIDSKAMRVHVRQGKGRKDRYTMLSVRMLHDLRHYYKMYKPKKFLFEGAKGHQYTASSLVKVVKRAAMKAGIQKNITPHTLRHSFATHLLENGVDIRYIQMILGHNSVKTTEIYTFVAIKHLKTIKNPLDL